MTVHGTILEQCEILVGDFRLPSHETTDIAGFGVAAIYVREVLARVDVR